LIFVVVDAVAVVVVTVAMAVKTSTISFWDEKRRK